MYGLSLGMTNMKQEEEAAETVTHRNLGEHSGSPLASDGEGACLQWASGVRGPWVAARCKGRSAWTSGKGQARREMDLCSEP